MVRCFSDALKFAKLNNCLHLIKIHNHDVILNITCWSLLCIFYSASFSLQKALHSQEEKEMNKLLIGLLISASTMANITTECVIKYGNHEVDSVKVTNPQASYGKFKSVEVNFKSGESEVFSTLNRFTTIAASTVESYNNILLRSESTSQIASLNYKFFARDIDQNPRGFSMKNGIAFELVLPAATEVITGLCHVVR